jgi:hypothetical protein
MSRRRRTVGDEIAELARTASIELTPWQREYLEYFYGPPVRPVRRHWRLALAMPRQLRRRPSGTPRRGQNTGGR